MSSIISKREKLLSEVSQLEQLLTLVEPDPIMSLAYKNKLEKKREELRTLPQLEEQATEPEATLYFYGDPVLGSIGISAVFISKVLPHFQHMVDTEYANLNNRLVANKGRIASSEGAKLHLTALPRGSFGLQLSRIQNGNIFKDEVLEKSLFAVTRLVNASKISDEEFDRELEDHNPRTLGFLSKFLAAIANDRAGLRLETGTIRSELTIEEARIAHNRVASKELTQETITVSGRFDGVLPNSNRFEFIPDSENLKQIEGKVSPELLEENALAELRRREGSMCLAELLVLKSTPVGGETKRTYVLLQLKDIV